MTTNAAAKKFRKPTKTEKTDNDYIDKDEFYQELVEYKRQLKEAEAKGLPEPLPSNRIGEFIMVLVDRIIKSHRFNGYTDLWKDEMRSEGIISACRSIKAFDTDRFKNPFAYFTTAVYYTFYGVIKREKKFHEIAIKYNTQEHSDYTEIGADGFTYTIPEGVHDRIADNTKSFYDSVDYQEELIERQETLDRLKAKEERINAYKVEGEDDDCGDDDGDGEKRNSHPEKPKPEKKKRGRKPKPKPEDELEALFASLDSLEDLSIDEALEKFAN